MTHPIEQKVSLFLEEVCDGKASVPEEIIEEFGERCKNVLRESFVERPVTEKKFTLRMSNIGHPLRQLMLDKAAGGKYRPSKQWKLKATVGHIYEAFMLALLKASKVNVEDHDKHVTLDVNGTKIQGTYDVKIDGKIYDIKTASDFSYNYKFSSIDDLRKEDSFGYFAQGFGYALADKSLFGGWIPINKLTGDFKVLEIPLERHTELQIGYEDDIKYVVEHINDDKIPPCTGVIDELWRGKPTGNKVLNNRCSYCDHKHQCHPGLQALPDINSKAMNRKLKYYVERCTETGTDS